MALVAVVTDTSADLTPAEAEARAIGLVPLTVSFGDDTFQAGTELSNEAFYEHLTAPGAPFPKTAAPAPAAFESVFREAIDGGAGGVVCLTLSAEMSATWANAVQGAASFGDRVTVLDTRTTTLGQGLMVLAAAEAAAAGASLREVVARIEDLRSRSRIYFGLETLEYLRRGGRIGRASELLGSVLSLRPILTVTDGVVEAADRRRTTAKAQARLIELCAARPVERAIVLHTLTSGIEGFADRLAEAIGHARPDVDIGLVGAVAGAHVGPGVYGAALVLAA